MMKYYFSGVATFNQEWKKKLAPVTPYRLLSCHGDYIRYAHEWLQYAIEGGGGKNIEIILDSGAFTAWKSGREVTLEELMPVYTDFMHRYQNELKAIRLVNLDKIPGSLGVTASDEEVLAAIAESDRNYKVLVDTFGDRVFPVFHQGEPKGRLLEVAGMADYICISPRNDVSERYRYLWASEVHEALGKIGVRTHGMATTGNEMLSNVKWYSADSSSWIYAGSVGHIIALFGDRMLHVPFSKESTDQKKKNKHYLSMNEEMQKAVDARLALHGFTAEQMVESYGDRMAFNLLEHIEWMKHLEVDTVNQQGLFDL